MVVQKNEGEFKMELSRKDFIQVALSLSNIENNDARKTATNIQVEMLKGTNPRFDEARFRRYVEEHVRKRILGF